MDRQERRELKHDKFIDEIGSLSLRARENQRMLILGTSAAILVALLIYGIYFYRTNREEKAQLALANAIDTINSPLIQPGQPNPDAKYKTEQERSTAAQQQFQVVTNDYSGTNAADVAAIYLARLSADRGDLATAQKDLTKFLDDHPKSVVAGSARYGLYQIRIDNGQSQQVISELENELKSDKPSLPGDTLLNLEASAYEVLGQSGKAKDAYKRIILEYPDSPYALQAQRRVGPAA